MKYLLAVACGTILFGACSLNDADYKIKKATSNPTVAVPLIQGSMGIVDVFSSADQQYIKTDPDGLISLNYSQTLITQDIRNLVDLPNFNATRSVQVPAATYPATSVESTIGTTTFPLDMNTSPEKLTEILFKRGTLGFNIAMVPSNPNFQYDLILTIPEFKNSSGQVFSQRTSAGSISTSLVGYTLATSTSNRFNLQVTLIRKPGNVVVIGPNTNVNIAISMTNLDFTYIKGFFGDQTANPPEQSLNIDAFGNSLITGQAKVSFKSPQLSLTAITDYGVPLQVNFVKLLGQKPGSTIPITISPANPVNVNIPLTLGTSASTTVAVTNVTDVINFAPKQLVYRVSGRMNAGLTSGNNFMADTSKLRIRLDAKIPLWGNASDITLYDTATIDLSSIKQTQVDNATLQTNFTNQMPIDANIQLLLVDANFKLLGSLIPNDQNPLVKGSTVDANGDLKTAGQTTKSIVLDGPTLTKLFEAKKMILVAKLNTSGGSGGATDVKFKSQYKLTSSVSLLAQLKLSATF